MTRKEGGAKGATGTMYPSLSWTAPGCPLRLQVLPPRHRCPRAQDGTASFLDRATSSPGTHTPWTASHTACTARTTISAPEIEKQKRYNDENSLASVVLMVAGRGATLYLPPAAEETCQLGTQHGALAPRQRKIERRLESTLTLARGRGRSACRR